MKFTTNKTNTSVEFMVEFEPADFEPVRLKALERLARNVKIPGFRNGKAPSNVVEQHVDANQLVELMLDILVRQSIPKIYTEAKVNPISVPHVEVLKYIPSDSAEIKITSDIMPAVKLPDYTKLKANYSEPTIIEQDIDDVIDRIAGSMAESKVVKRPTRLGDEIIFDFKGSKDGKAFEGGSAKDYKLVLGSGQFIPGFEDALVGHETGEKFDIHIKFPKNYAAEELAGQPVDFEILIKQVNQLDKPALDDDFAKKTGGFNTMAELRKDIHENLAAQANQEADNRFKDELLNKLVDGSKTEAPKSLVDEQIARLREDMERNMQARKITLDDYLKEHKQKESDYLSELRQAAERRVISSIVVQALSEDMKIEVDETEVEKQLAEMRHVYRKDEKATANLDNPDVINSIRNQIRINQTMNKLVALNRPNAKVSKVDRSSKNAKTAKSAKK